jgi:hypothetical protein
LIRWFGSALLCLLSGLAGSVELVHVELGTVEAQQWKVQDAVLTLDLDANEPRLALHIAHIQLGEHSLDAVKFDCQVFSLFSDRVDCVQAQLGFLSDVIRADALPASFSWQFSSRQLKMRCRWQAAK